MRGAGPAELPCEHVGCRHRQRRSLTCHERHAECGIADEPDAAPRPVWHLDLAYAVEVEVVRGVDRVENARRFPAAASIPPSQHLLLGGEAVIAVQPRW